MANPISKVVAWTLSKGVKSRPYQMLEGKINRKTVDNIIAYTTIGSIAAKDTVGCGMYVYQSKNNKKIPEERRKFVWKLDLTNGVLMVASQIAFFFAMRKYSGKLFDKVFKSFNTKNMNSYIEQVRVNQKKLNIIPESKGDLTHQFVGMKDVALSLFKSVTELIASTILAKRVVVPFIATPLASQLEKWEEKKAAKRAANQQNGTLAHEPSMKGSVEIPKIEQIPQGNSNLIEKYKQSIK
ncbi:hypothetical protein IJ579_05280 [bacterium]|nr:hypothetical protein [bacterium]